MNPLLTIDKKAHPFEVGLLVVRLVGNSQGSGL